MQEFVMEPILLPNSMSLQIYAPYEVHTGVCFQATVSELRSTIYIHEEENSIPHQILTKGYAYV